MNKTIIYARTAKGDRALSAATDGLARNLRDVLKAIDGRSSVEALRSTHGNLSAATLDEALATLATEEYICESAGSMPAYGSSQPQGRADQSGDESARRAQELRAKIRARREGGERSTQEAEVRSSQREEQARHDAEEHTRREAAERARHEADAKARRQAEEESRRQAEEESRRKAEEESRRKAEEESRRKAEEEARRQAEEEARRQAEEEVRRKAEEEARRKAEEEARRKAEEEARRKAEEEARRKAEEEARRKAEEEAPRKAEEEARKKAEKEAKRKADEETADSAWKRAQVQARLLAEDQAWQEEQAQAMMEAAEKASQAAEEKARREAEASALASAKAAPAKGKAGSRKPAKRGRVIVLGLVALLVAGLVALHLISFDRQIPRFEELVAAQLQEPVKIRALHIALVPQPHLRLEGVSVGSAGQIRVPVIKAAGELGNLYRDKKVFKAIEFDSLVITEEGLGWILFSKLPTRDLVFDSATAQNTTLESKNISLSAFDARLAADDEGGWKTIAIQARDKSFSVDLASKGDSLKIDINAQSFKVPFGSTLTLEDFVGTGTANSAGLVLTDFKGFVLGGTISGNARLRWGADWSLAGQLNAKQIDTTRIVPDLIDGGRVAGDASFAMQASDGARLFAAPRIEGSLTIPRGTMLGVDLGSLLQGGEKRGDTRFTDLSASFLHEGGVTQFRQARFGQGGMSATGTVDVDADKNVRGRFAADLKLSTELRRANYAISGTLKKVEWRRQ